MLHATAQEDTASGNGLLNKPMMPPLNFSKLNAKLQPGVKRGSVDASRRTATPYCVRQDGLCEDLLGQRRFCQDREERRLWMIEHRVGEHEIEPIRDAHGRLSGFLYRFAASDEAFAFRMRF